MNALVNPDRWRLFADECTYMAQWEAWETSVYNILCYLYYPIALMFVASRRQLHLRRLHAFFLQHSQNFMNSAQSIRRVLQTSVCLGVSDDCTLVWLDFFQTQQDAMPSGIRVGKPSLPGVLVCSGDGSLWHPYHIDLSDPMTKICGAQFFGPNFFRFACLLNACLRPLSPEMLSERQLGPAVRQCLDFLARMNRGGIGIGRKMPLGGLLVQLGVMPPRNLLLEVARPTLIFTPSDVRDLSPPTVFAALASSPPATSLSPSRSPKSGYDSTLSSFSSLKPTTIDSAAAEILARKEKKRSLQQQRLSIASAAAGTATPAVLDVVIPLAADGDAGVAEPSEMVLPRASPTEALSPRQSDASSTIVIAPPAAPMILPYGVVCVSGVAMSADGSDAVGTALVSALPGDQGHGPLDVFLQCNISQCTMHAVPRTGERWVWAVLLVVLIIADVALQFLLVVNFLFAKYLWGLLFFVLPPAVTVAVPLLGLAAMVTMSPWITRLFVATNALSLVRLNVCMCICVCRCVCRGCVCVSWLCVRVQVGVAVGGCVCTCIRVWVWV